MMRVCEALQPVYSALKGFCIGAVLKLVPARELADPCLYWGLCLRLTSAKQSLLYVLLLQVPPLVLHLG